MPPGSKECPNDDQLRTLLDAECDEQTRVVMEQHIGDCATCRERMSDLSSANGWQRLMPSDGVVDVTTKALETLSGRDVPTGQPARIGRYETIRKIGHGGMGVVYLAADLELGRNVAIKVLAPGRQGDATWLTRFRREAKMASALNHPNVLTVHEIGEVDARPYIATELVEGQTLSQLLATSRLSVQRSLELAIQIVSGMAAAHAVDIVHRDLKPDNVMIRDDDIVKILDFGLARVTTAGDPAMSAVSDSGLVVGTVSYMSPEQARGVELDVSSDVFSFGTMLFMMLTGQRPFTGDTPSDVMAAILTRAPRAISDCQVELPPGLSRLLMQCLNKDPKLRPSSSELLTQLQTELVAARSHFDPDESSTEALKASPSENVPADAATAIDQLSEVHYARSGDVNIAWQEIGNGPIDVVFVMGWVSHLEWFWKDPSFSAFLQRLASFSRVILFDKRGTGLSDRVPLNELPTLETRMDDVRAVMDAAGSQRAVLCGVSEGGPLCTLFAATYPQKTIALAMIGCYARRLWAEDYPWGPTAAQREVFLEEIRKNWGGPLGIEDRAPSVANDTAFRKWWASYLRMGASPGAAVALTKMNAQIDVRPILPSIQVPTLVIHRTGDRCLLVEEGQHMADLIPGAKFVELPGDDHLPFVGDANSILDEIEEFLTGKRHAPAVDRVLSTVLCLIVEESTANEERFRTLVEHEAALFRGQNLTVSSDKMFLTFDGPARAVRAASAMMGLATRLDINIRCGVDTGPCDVGHDLLGGPAVDRAAQIAEGGNLMSVLVSAAVKNLVSGSGLEFLESSTQNASGEGTLHQLVR